MLVNELSASQNIYLANTQQSNTTRTFTIPDIPEEKTSEDSNGKRIGIGFLRYV